MFKIFKQNLLDIAKERNVPSDNMTTDEWIRQAYIRTYNDFPRIINYTNAIVENEEIEEITYSDIISGLIPIINKELSNKGIDVEKTVQNICNKYPDSIIIRMGEMSPIIYNDQFIIYVLCGTIFFHQNNIIKELFKYFKPRSVKEKAAVYYVSKGNYGFETYPFELNVKDIEGNYNDDLPLEKINNIIQNEESSIILFNGVPGGGKSSFIRYIIDKNKKDKKFLYLDSSVFHYITDSSFIQFLMRFKNSIIILEDCEQLLKSREDSGRNELISTILNISDGLLGDSLNLKFICTFNTDLTNIDKAITRKGRLKLKYEFKPLCREKVAKIFEKQGINPKLAKEMTLAEAYNFEEDNGANDKRKKVGF